MAKPSDKEIFERLAQAWLKLAELRKRDREPELEVFDKIPFSAHAACVIVAANSAAVLAVDHRSALRPFLSFNIYLKQSSSCLVLKLK
jgi:hypothetical protein